MGRNQNLSGSNDSLIKKGAWTETEDQILIDHVKKNGEGKWERVQKHTGENRFFCVLESSPDGTIHTVTCYKQYIGRPAPVVFNTSIWIREYCRP